MRPVGGPKMPWPDSSPRPVGGPKMPTHPSMKRGGKVKAKKRSKGRKEEKR